MMDISANARELLTVLARNNDGTSRWTAADLAQIYERPTPNIDETLKELVAAEFVSEIASGIGRRATDRYKLSETGWRYLEALEAQPS